ncbi:unnamed protein product, partial [Staurois parvus]
QQKYNPLVWFQQRPGQTPKPYILKQTERYPGVPREVQWIGIGNKLSTYS